MELQGRRKNAYLGEDNNKDKDEGDDHSSGKRTFYSSLSFSISLLSLLFLVYFPLCYFPSSSVFSLGLLFCSLSIALLCYLLNCFTLFSLQSFWSPLLSLFSLSVFLFFSSPHFRPQRSVFIGDDPGLPSTLCFSLDKHG